MRSSPARRANDHRLPAAQKDAQTFLFHGRVEPTNDASALVAPERGLVVRG
jgi:hypothetical protein